VTDYLECPSCGCVDMRLVITEEGDEIAKTSIECAHCSQLINGAGVIQREAEESDELVN
jgi:uncharacterized Zn finger protein